MYMQLEVGQITADNEMISMQVVNTHKILLDVSVCKVDGTTKFIIICVRIHGH